MDKYLREEVKKMKAYVVDEGDYELKLDANEGFNWVEGLNRYPDDSCLALRWKLAEKLDKKPEEFLLGNGSSELIDLVMKTYLEAGEKVVTPAPAFSMYQIYTIINRGVYREFPLGIGQDLDVEAFIQFIKEEGPKIVIICNPNNPTGAVISRGDIRRIVEVSDAMVVLDEAYIEFSDLGLKDDTGEFKNLIVLRTFSKAYGLAAIRLGYMMADEGNINEVNRVRAPYSVNALTQGIALEVLEREEEVKSMVEQVKGERERVRAALDGFGFTTYPSQANFIFFSAYEDLAKDLEKKKVLIRSYGGGLEGYFRLTIGCKEENESLLEVIKEVLDEKSKP